MDATSAKTLLAILSAVREYTPDDVYEAVNLYSINARFCDDKAEATRAVAIKACEDAIAYWQVCPGGAKSGNFMAVAAIRAFLEHN